MGFLVRVSGGARGAPRNPDGVYVHCGWCGREILYGDTSVAVARSTEWADEGGVSVLEAEALLLLCEPCGDRLDARALQRALVGLRPGRDQP